MTSYAITESFLSHLRGAQSLYLQGYDSHVENCTHQVLLDMCPTGSNAERMKILCEVYRAGCGYDLHVGLSDEFGLTIEENDLLSSLEGDSKYSLSAIEQARIEGTLNLFICLCEGHKAFSLIVLMRLIAQTMVDACGAVDNS